MVSDLSRLMAQCAPGVHPVTMQAVVRTESGGNPYAIGVVGGRLIRQPRTLGEALATTGELERAGWNYSVGLAQVNRSHFAEYGLTGAAAFDACRNLRVGADILSRCYVRAAGRVHAGQAALRDGLSCYYSGNFQTGYRTGYVQRVAMNAAQAAAVRLPAVPAIEVGGAIPVIPDAASSWRGGTARGARQAPDSISTPGAGNQERQPTRDDTDPASISDTPNDSAVVF
ncbi:hypothetical protein DF141_06530 [Burkholderia cenocepacia]|nr:hypothetical protein DF141_06530 [Burkholderia cenocepacia]